MLASELVRALTSAIETNGDKEVMITISRDHAMATLVRHELAPDWSVINIMGGNLQ